MEQLTERVFGQVEDPQVLPREFISLLELTDEYDDEHTESVLESIAAKEAQLWLYMAPGGNHGLIVTQLLNYPAGKELYIWRLVGQGLNPAYEFISEILETYALKEGCGRIRTVIRPELAHVMLQDGRGYRTTGVEIAKELDNV